MCAEGDILCLIKNSYHGLPAGGSGQHAMHSQLPMSQCGKEQLGYARLGQRWSGVCFRPLCFSSPFWMLSEVTDVECCPGHQGWRAFLGEG